MNKIIEISDAPDGEKTPKTYEILVAESGGEIDGVALIRGQAAVIPPLKKYVLNSFKGLKISFDNALLPFTEITVIADDGAVYETTLRAKKYFFSDIPKKDFLLSSIGNLLISYLIAFSDRKEFSPVVETVRGEILKGVSDCTFSLEDRLKKLPLNYDYIRKTFKKETGMTPHDYLLKERMTLAQQLISSGISNRFSPYSVSQIAEACGFSDPLYFSRVFKKYFGASPSEYK